MTKTDFLSWFAIFDGVFQITSWIIGGISKSKTKKQRWLLVTYVTSVLFISLFLFILLFKKPSFIILIFLYSFLILIGIALIHHKKRHDIKIHQTF